MRGRSSARTDWPAACKARTSIPRSATWTPRRIGRMSAPAGRAARNRQPRAARHPAVADGQLFCLSHVGPRHRRFARDALPKRRAMVRRRRRQRRAGPADRPTHTMNASSIHPPLLRRLRLSAASRCHCIVMHAPHRHCRQRRLGTTNPTESTPSSRSISPAALSTN